MIAPSPQARLASALMPLLRRLDAEAAHRIAIRALAGGALGRVGSSDVRLRVRAMGFDLANPLGLAAGFDKNAVAVRGALGLGFGAVEVGTVTPRPQAGNPRPRMFRLPEARAVINRMGFPNDGWESVGPRIAALRAAGALPGRLGINIGINKDSADPAADYASLAAAAAPLADWITVNVSSPNTPGLRDLQSADRLAALLDAVHAALPRPVPIAVKLAPDLDEPALDEAVEVAAAKAQALIISNTTLSRHGVSGRAAAEKGGLSGPPLMELSTRVLAHAFRRSGGKLTLIGAGGVGSAGDVLRKIRAGASLVQLYTALAWHGPALPARILGDLSQALAEQKTIIPDLVGVDA
jgi:dihydroorotate dehydrogenase